MANEPQLPSKIPPHLATLIQRGATPLEKQFVASTAELNTAQWENTDPIGDTTHSPVPGLVHRYHDRVLLMPTMHCGVYCRFCFRKDQVGRPGNELNPMALESCAQYIRSNPQITEVILSGGDPLHLPAKRLRLVLEALSKIETVKRLRIHTRMATANPIHLEKQILPLLLTSQKRIYLVHHTNHPQEIQQGYRQAIEALRLGGIVQLHQAVLLAGVNDCEAILSQMLENLVDLGVTPYYLHILDPAEGTDHFRVKIPRALEIMENLRGRLPGYALPRLCLETPGGGGKVTLTPGWLRTSDSSGEMSVKSPLTGQWVTLDRSYY